MLFRKYVHVIGQWNETINISSVRCNWYQLISWNCDFVSASSYAGSWYQYVTWQLNDVSSTPPINCVFLSIYICRANNAPWTPYAQSFTNTKFKHWEHVYDWRIYLPIGACPGIIKSVCCIWAESIHLCYTVNLVMKIATPFPELNIRGYRWTMPNLLQHPSGLMTNEWGLAFMVA